MFVFWLKMAAVLLSYIHMLERLLQPLQVAIPAAAVGGAAAIAAGIAATVFSVSIAIAAFSFGPADTQTDSQTHTQTHTDRHAQTHTDTHTYRLHRHTQTDTHRHTQTHRHSHIDTRPQTGFVSPSVCCPSVAVAGARRASPGILCRHADGEGAAPTSDGLAASSDTHLRDLAASSLVGSRTQHRVQ